MRKITALSAAGLAGVLALASFAALPTRAEEKDEAKSCGNAPREQWMKEDDLKSKLTAEGYEVKKIKVEDGCYEAYAKKDGKKFEIYLNPVSGDVVKTKED